jgi:hypothetical protein
MVVFLCTSDLVFKSSAFYQLIVFVFQFSAFKKATISFAMPLCPSVRLENLDTIWKNFCEIYFVDFTKI